MAGDIGWVRCCAADCGYGAIIGMIGICIIVDCCAETGVDACGVRDCDGEVSGVGEGNTGGCGVDVGEAEVSPW